MAPPRTSKDKRSAAATATAKAPRVVVPAKAAAPVRERASKPGSPKAKVIAALRKLHPMD